MIAGGDAWLLTAMLAFARIGGCFMLLPGISSARIAVSARLFLALAFTLAVLPLVHERLAPSAGAATGAALVGLLLSELALGVSIGLAARLFFSALQFGGIFIATLIGLNTAPSAGIEDDEATLPLANVLTLGAVLSFYLADQHAALLLALVRSFENLPVERGFDAAAALDSIVATLGLTFLLALQISAPFVVYSVAINLLLGILNRMIPQVPVQFVSVPIMLGGGLLVFYLLIGPMLVRFQEVFDAWLVGT